MMTMRTWAAISLLAATALMACDDDKSTQDAGATGSATAAAAGASLEARCEQLGKACGEADKHKEAITKACKQAAAAQGEKGCSAQVLAAYDCYEKELCGKIKKIWALDDFRVLTTRHNICVDVRDASAKCMGTEADKQ